MDRIEKLIFGVDIGGTTCKLGMFSKQGELIEKWEVPTDVSHDGKYILPAIAKAITYKMKEKCIEREEIIGIGIGVPGLVKKDGTVKNCVNLGWKEENPNITLQKLINIPVHTLNDANAAALGELWKGAGKGRRNAVMITLGTGVGGGVIVDGKIITGTNGAAGEIGHFLMFPDEIETCGCGSHGCLEQYVSATGLVRITKNALLKNMEASALRDYEVLTADIIFAIAKEGDEVAKKCIGQFSDILALALSRFTAMYDPEIFIIGGGVSNAGAYLIDSIKSQYCKYTFKVISRQPDIVLASLRNDAGIYGCACNILDSDILL